MSFNSILNSLSAERLRAFPSGSRADSRFCAPIKRPERQWPLPKDRHCSQTFLFGRAESEDAAWRHHPLIKSTTEASFRKSGKHQPSAPSAHYTSEKVAPTSLGMSLFLDAPFPTGTDRCRLSSMERPKSVTS